MRREMHLQRGNSNKNPPQNSVYSPANHFRAHNETNQISNRNPVIRIVRNSLKTNNRDQF
jgi:hypothetical protein